MFDDSSVQPIVNIFLELNGNEWIEETYSGVETVRRDLPANQQPELVITNIIDETEHNLIIPSDEETADILKAGFFITLEYFSHPIISKIFQFKWQ